jgi:ubiquinone/menaquinone biosynthesis C-methylase UbiE
MTHSLDIAQNQASKLAAPALDLEAVKARQRATWGSGDFALIGTTLQIVGESLSEAADLAAGSRVLDVACGNGNATLAAARRFCVTVGVDYVPALLARAQERAAAERLPIDFVEGDAEALPFPSESFDTVLSTFGVMFAPNHARAADELLRVTAAGGRIALASWTAEGFLGAFFKTVAARVPPPAGMPSPFVWGSEEKLATLFGARARVVRSERKPFVFRYRSAAHMIEIFRTFYGPTLQAFKALDERGQAELSNDLTELITRADRGAGRALAVPAEYLEIVLEKR